MVRGNDRTRPTAPSVAMRCMPLAQVCCQADDRSDPIRYEGHRDLLGYACNLAMFTKLS
jgi:hypothetical protein